ncbi:hypothetical protein [Dokdonella sp.]|uniref:hypothetical protein n=1 Tax=Dokdonella sp. TaxID=2291710 RepID=UPI001B048C54|nr:hypothetical protein [Dokdonella sp.]MBO9661715.1 hypothetical protein [Dokdonella sp.]
MAAAADVTGGAPAARADTSGSRTGVARSTEARGIASDGAAVPSSGAIDRGASGLESSSAAGGLRLRGVRGGAVRAGAAASPLCDAATSVASPLARVRRVVVDAARGFDGARGAFGATFSVPSSTFGAARRRTGFAGVAPSGVAASPCGDAALRRRGVFGRSFSSMREV